MPDPLAEAIKAQAESNRKLAEEIGRLADELGELKTTTDRTDRRSRWTAAAGMLASLVLVVGTAVVVIENHERNDRAEQSRQILEAIRACTEPGHSCYDNNQVRSSQRLAPIVAAVCDILPEAKLPEHRQLCPADG